MTQASMMQFAGYQLAEVNVARLRDREDSDLLADFVAAVDPVNAVAEAADGFVWRRTRPMVNAFRGDVADGAGVVVTISVWRDLDALVAFVRGAAHVAPMSRRREWFHPMEQAHVACWWVPAGHRPSPREAEDRLRALRADGPTPAAFDLRHPFPPPADPGP